MLVGTVVDGQVAEQLAVPLLRVLKRHRVCRFDAEGLDEPSGRYRPLVLGVCGPMQMCHNTRPRMTFTNALQPRRLSSLITRQPRQNS